MVKTFREFISEGKRAKSVDVEAVRQHMDDTYRGAAPDLPRHNNYHFGAAVDHVAQMAHDHFPQHRDTVNFQKLAHGVVRRYSHDDTRASKAAENRRMKILQKTAVKKFKAPEMEKPKKRWDDLQPPPKSKRGVGSR